MGIATTIGLDIAKSVFQVHGVDAAGEVVTRRKLRIVLQDYEAEPLPVHLVHTAQSILPLKMRRFLEFATAPKIARYRRHRPRVFWFPLGASRGPAASHLPPAGIWVSEESHMITADHLNNSATSPAGSRDKENGSPVTEQNTGSLSRSCPTFGVRPSPRHFARLGLES